MVKMVTAYLGLGSNLGDRRGNITKALELLGRKARIETKSSLYESEPWGYRDQPMFLNAVCQVRTTLSPWSLLEIIKIIERDLGRVRSFPNAPRTIDIDILCYGNQIITDPDLTIPHPHMLERAFVMVPLADIAPKTKHPKEGKTMKQLAAKTKGKGKLRPWAEPQKHPWLVCQDEFKVKIRELIPNDYAQVWRLWQSCKIPMGKGFDQAALKRMRQHDPDLCLVAELNQVIIGVAIGFLHGSHGRIYNHAVDTHCRGRGIGTKLFEEIENRLKAKGAAEIEAMIPRESLEGREFFVDLGFSEDNRYLFMVKQY